MTAESTQTSPRSRRALLAGALGGLGVWAASVIGRAAPAEAAAGDPIRMGRLNLASSTATTLQTKTSRAALLVNQLGPGAAVKGVATSGRAIMGEAGNEGTGLWGSSPNHNGVHGISNLGIGVFGESTSGKGVYAFTSSGQAVYGETESGAAVVGFSVTGTGVYGSSNQGYAGDFFGHVRVHGYQHIDEWTDDDPPAPAANGARLFVRDNGSGKEQLCVRFPTGAVQVLATEP